MRYLRWRSLTLDFAHLAEEDLGGEVHLVVGVPVEEAHRNHHLAEAVRRNLLPEVVARYNHHPEEEVHYSHHPVEEVHRNHHLEVEAPRSHLLGVAVHHSPAGMGPVDRPSPGAAYPEVARVVLVAFPVVLPFHLGPGVQHLATQARPDCSQSS